MKYVMLAQKTSDNSCVMTPIIFPSDLVHKDVAESIKKLMEQMRPNKEVQIISAGTAVISNITLGGYSETLNLVSKPTDQLIVSFIDYVPFQELPSPYWKEKEVTNG